ncbi:hypothetical protein [Actinoallomurus iriomotensis]|uniref:hypothetical protein n=1 Tax=Actinoallomurus iriomotensis TaxID=478107 RepID=UPI002557C109|nr:hypothetical protein [Actinoallomurus iriomotensis]
MGAEIIGGGGSYRRALASPGALRFCAAGLAGRMQIGMVGLGTVLLVASITGRYGWRGRWPRPGRPDMRWCHP